MESCLISDEIMTPICVNTNINRDLLKVDSNDEEILLKIFLNEIKKN